MKIGNWFKKNENESQIIVQKKNEIVLSQSEKRKNLIVHPFRSISLQTDATEEEVKKVLMQYVEAGVIDLEDVREKIDVMRGAERKKISGILPDVFPEAFHRQMIEDYEKNLEVLYKNKLVVISNSFPKDPFYITQFAVEKDKFWKNFQCYVPKIEEIIGWITLEQRNLYFEMMNHKLDPKLTMVPIGLRYEHGSGLDLDNFQYFPEGFKIINKSIKMIGGKSKYQVACENKGWLVRIVSMRPDLDSDLKDEVEAAIHFNRLLKAGLRGLDFETFMMTQLIADEMGIILDSKTSTVLPDACPPYYLRESKLKRIFQRKVMKSLPVGRVDFSGENQEKQIEFRDHIISGEPLAMRLCLPINRPR